MTAQPICSLIIVNYNGVDHLQRCLASLQHIAYAPDQLDLIVIENDRDRSSTVDVCQRFPGVQAFANTENNFAKALNLGVSRARGDYIGFLNNDVTLEPRWLAELVTLLEAEPTAGAAGGKILFNDGRINSVGHHHLPNFYFEDLGFNEEDRGQYATVTDVLGLCWAAVLFRRTCLDDVGEVDEDFVMYLEDVDYAMRCRTQGWRLLYTPKAIAYHEFHGSSANPNIPYYFYNRNRFLYVARHVPEALPQAITTSHFFNNRQYDQLFECVPFMIKTLLMHHQADVVVRVLTGLCAVLEPLYGIDAIDRMLARMQVVLGHRKMSIGIYSPELHHISDTPAYPFLMGSEIHDDFDLTYLHCQEADMPTSDERNACLPHQRRLKAIYLPADQHSHALLGDGSSQQHEDGNRCQALSEESASYDLFINTDLLQAIIPRSQLSMALCHALDDPSVLPSSVQGYTFLVAERQRVSQRMASHSGGQSRQERKGQRSDLSVPTVFGGELRGLLSLLRSEYATMHRPDPEDVARIVFNVRIMADPRVN